MGHGETGNSGDGLFQQAPGRVTSGSVGTDPARDTEWGSVSSADGTLRYQPTAFWGLGMGVDGALPWVFEVIAWAP